MKVGLMLPHVGRQASREMLAGAAQGAEALGYDSVWALDRLLFPTAPRTPYPPAPDGKLPEALQTCFEPLITFAWLAGQTKTIRFGSGVLVSAFRSPALLARMAATLDNLSGGRFICGVGMGWSQDEYAASGVGFDHKGKRFDEYLEALRAALSAETHEYQGQYYELPRNIMNPRPVQHPLPVWIGGDTPPACKRAARYGTGWYASAYNTELAEAVASIKAELTRLGRDDRSFAYGAWGPFGFTKEPMGPLAGPVEHVRQAFEHFRKIGITHVTLAAGMLPGTNAMEDIARFAQEVLSSFAAAS